MNIKILLRAIAANIPKLHKVVFKSTGGTTSARYCYSVWLRHLVMAHKNGLLENPKVIAELGPGDSIGIGLTALLSGAEKYYALDAIRFIKTKRNIEILNELADLFRKREAIPDENEFPRVLPRLDSYKFPENILTKERLNESLGKERIKSIRNVLLDGGMSSGGIQISYFAPWHNSDIIKSNSVDMIYSQAVLEHIENLKFTYSTLYKWLKPDGFMSHVIDFKSHRYAKKWNGHWGYSKFLWKLIRGRRTFLLNRHPYSSHTGLMQKAGFKIISNIKTKDTSGILRKNLASEFKNISDNDLITSEVFIQAIKK